MAKITKWNLVLMVLTTSTMDISRVVAKVRTSSAVPMPTIHTDSLDTRVKATTNGLTMHGTNGALITTGTPRKLSIINGATTLARST